MSLCSYGTCFSHPCTHRPLIIVLVWGRQSMEMSSLAAAAGEETGAPLTLAVRKNVDVLSETFRPELAVIAPAGHRLSEKHHSNITEASDRGSSLTSSQAESTWRDGRRRSLDWCFQNRRIAGSVPLACVELAPASDSRKWHDPFFFYGLWVYKNIPNRL